MLTNIFDHTAGKFSELNDIVPWHTNPYTERNYHFLMTQGHVSEPVFTMAYEA